MTDREQAVREISEKLGCDPEILAAQMSINTACLFNNAEYKVEAVLQLERAIVLGRENSRLQSAFEEIRGMANGYFVRMAEAETRLAEIQEQLKQAESEINRVRKAVNEYAELQGIRKIN